MKRARLKSHKLLGFSVYFFGASYVFFFPDAMICHTYIYRRRFYLLISYCAASTHKYTRHRTQHPWQPIDLGVINKNVPRIKWSEYSNEFYTQGIIEMLQISLDWLNDALRIENFRFHLSILLILFCIPSIRCSEVESFAVVWFGVVCFEYFFSSLSCSIIWWNIWNQMYAWYVEAIANAIYQQAYKLTWYSCSTMISNKVKQNNMKQREKTEKKRKKRGNQHRRKSSNVLFDNGNEKYQRTKSR